MAASNVPHTTVSTVKNDTKAEDESSPGPILLSSNYKTVLGKLGSQCNLINCEKPGKCFSDGFCHCDLGVHQDGICFVTSDNYLVQFLIACAIIILFFTAAALAYQTFWSVRHHGRFCWCRWPSFYRRRRRRRRRSSRQRQYNRSREVKTPAYTAQQRIYQNFHRRNDSESTSDEDNTDEENISDKNTEVDSISTIIEMDTIRKTDERNLQHENIKLSTFSIKTEAPQERPSTSAETNDVTGMTDYYNENSTDL